MRFICFSVLVLKLNIFRVINYERERQKVLSLLLVLNLRYQGKYQGKKTKQNKSKNKNDIPIYFFSTTV